MQAEAWVVIGLARSKRDPANKTLSPEDFVKDLRLLDVKNGVVRLTGTVPTGARRLEAAVLARSIQGVRAVNDDLRLETVKR